MGWMKRFDADAHTLLIKRFVANAHTLFRTVGERPGICLHSLLYRTSRYERLMQAKRKLMDG